MFDKPAVRVVMTTSANVVELNGEIAQHLERIEELLDSDISTRLDTKFLIGIHFQKIKSALYFLGLMLCAPKGRFKSIYEQTQLTKSQVYLYMKMNEHLKSIKNHFGAWSYPSDNQLQRFVESLENQQ